MNEGRFINGTLVLNTVPKSGEKILIRDSAGDAEVKVLMVYHTDLDNFIQYVYPEHPSTPCNVPLVCLMG